MKKSTALVSCLLLTGCASVPQTRITFNPKTGEVDIQSPKNTKITGFKGKVESGRVDVSFDSCSAENDPNVIAAVAAANAQMAQKVGEIADKVIESSAKAAVKSAKP